MRDETSWRDISSPGTMACKFIKVSLYFLIYDRWPVLYSMSVLVSKTNTSVPKYKVVKMREILKNFYVF